MAMFKSFLRLPDKSTGFLVVWIVILLAISITYISVHSATSNGGGLRRQLSPEEITLMNNLDDSGSFKEQAIQFLKNKYDLLPESVTQLETILGTYNKKNALAIISQVGIVNRSFFWLKNDMALLEVIFWALFGTICSFLYYFVENYKKGTLDKKEYPSYFAKLFYTPFLVLVLYVAPNLVSNNGINTHFDYWTIVIGFILGFFSGRAIELLDRIKNLIFPYKPADNPPAATTPPAIPEEAYIEALKEHAAEWNKDYGPLEGISVARKITAGVDTGIFSLQFHVTKKETPDGTGKVIPPFIPFQYKGADYELVTDVVSSGEVRGNLCYTPTGNNYIGSGINPKFLGLSCSRDQSSAFGTIGFKARSRDENDNKSYLVSCYHVLCHDELAQGILKVDDPGLSKPITSPEFGQQGNLTIGHVRKGALNVFIDAGYAELTQPGSLNNLILGTVFSPSVILILAKEHVDAKYRIMLAGRTSCMQVGYVISHYANVTVNYYNGASLIASQNFQGVIKTCKISTFGDSGAPVVDLKGNAIGILFASDNEYSYIIPLLTIFNFFNITFPK